ncbi:hypothetical protein JVT61DRAFT_8739 [Boletus reticuloceps]|uniref:Uncharacterized protein n=1 Tax=Boletus reticuloceps TaxID=495285 RepID=A0A8I3A6C2_9AGAM|nr:hypothetical protein JVT61DRAFT_8739 [Boletus reticuloceps]
MVEVVLRVEAHHWELKEFEKTIVPEQLERWRTEYAEWEENKLNSNPFNSWIMSITLSAMRLRLVEEESQDLTSRTDVPLHPEVSPLILISSGLDLQDLQCIQFESEQCAFNLLDPGAIWQVTLWVWGYMQDQFMDANTTPLHAVSCYTMARRATGCSNNEKDIANRPEKIKLNFPSELSPGTPCDPRLQRAEWDL